MALIDRTTFEAERIDDSGTEHGTVEVTLRGKTKRVSARLVHSYGWLFAYDMTGRYVSGGKAWPASVMQYTNGTERVSFGRDDRSTRFNKANGLFFTEAAQ